MLAVGFFLIIVRKIRERELKMLFTERSNLGLG
jgi:hypothetical protein